jgi:hypothetical protein
MIQHRDAYIGDRADQTQYQTMYPFQVQRGRNILCPHQEYVKTHDRDLKTTVPSNIIDGQRHVGNDLQMHELDKNRKAVLVKQYRQEKI